MSRRKKDLFGAIQAAQHAGDTARQLEWFHKSKKWYQEASLLVERWKGPKENKAQIQLDLLCQQAMSLRGMGCYSEAVRMLQKAASSYRAKHDLSGLAYSTWALGTTYRFMGRFGKAETSLQAAIRLYKKCGDLSGQAYAEAGLGGTLRMKGRPKESGWLYRKANRFFTEVGDRFGRAYTFCGQGNALRMQGQIRAALKYMNRAIQLYTDLDQKGPRAFVLWSRSQANLLLKNYLNVLADLRAAQRLFNEVKDRRGLVYCALGWGSYFKSRRDPIYKKYFRQAGQSAQKYGLDFERAHAIRGLNNDPFAHQIYRRCDIDSKGFSRYKSLP